MYQNNLVELPRTTGKILEIVIIEPLDSREAHSAIQALHQWKIVGIVNWFVSENKTRSKQ